MTSKSHNSQDHHGDLRSRLQRARDARLPGGWAVSFPFPVFLFFFFFKKFQFPFLAFNPVFVCKCNTDVLMTAYKRRLQICFRGGSAAGEQQAPSSSSISTMADAEEREGKEKKKKGSACFERQRERETKQTKAGCSCQSHVALPVSSSLTSRRAGIHAHE